MIAELEMVSRQLGEVYAAMLVALAQIPDDRLNWRPTGECMTASLLAQHMGRANVTYSQFMEFGERRPQAGYVEDAPREMLLSRMETSLMQVREAFERITPERLLETAADDWEPIGAEIPGPLTPLWFACTMLTHSAYHVGQMNTLALLIEVDSSPD